MIEEGKEVSAGFSRINCAVGRYIVTSFHLFLEPLRRDREGGEDAGADCKTVHEILKRF